MRRRVDFLPVPGVEAVVQYGKAALVADDVEGGALAAAGREVEMNVILEADDAATGGIEAAA